MVKVRSMRLGLERCREEGGFICVAREHRQSLFLKRQEIYADQDSDRECDALADIQRQPVIDILDESDALLNCKQQLVYAWGAQQDLPDAATRWQVPQELLHVLATNEEVKSILKDPHVAEIVRHKGRYGAMDKIRLVQGGCLTLLLLGQLALGKRVHLCQNVLEYRIATRNCISHERWKAVARDVREPKVTSNIPRLQNAVTFSFGQL
jgi:hypothetical protein